MSLTQPDTMRNACVWFANLICDAFTDRCRILAFRSVDFLNIGKRMAFLRQVETELASGKLNDSAWAHRAALRLTRAEVKQGKRSGTAAMLCDFLRVSIQDAERGAAS